MGRVDAFTVAGLDLWFNSSDHVPPHLHARKSGHWEIRIYILECTEGHLEFSMKWPPNGTGPSTKERKALLAGVLSHRAALLEEWERKVVVKEDI